MKRCTALLFTVLLATVPPAPAAYRPLTGGGKKAAGKKESPRHTIELTRRALTAFFGAATVEDMAEQVRHPERALPRMKEYYKDTKPGPVKFEYGDDWRENELGRRLMMVTSVEVDFEDRFVAVEIPRAGPAMVDWEAFVGWCEIPWAKFAKEGSEAAKEFRVALKPSDYFNYDFSDEKKYACYSLVDKADETTLYAYCETGSKIHGELMRLMRGQEGRQTCILKLSMTAANAKNRQAKIESFVQSGWVEP